MDKKKISLIAAVVMGIAAILLINKYLQQVDQKQAQAPGKEVSRVVIAIKRISPGTAVERNMIELKSIPVDFIQPGALNSLESALGKRVAIDISVGEQILQSKFADSMPRGPGSTLAMKTPFGKRATTLSIDELSAVGGMVRPGDYVDVLGSFPFPQMVGDKVEMQVVSVMLFQNILVLAVGNELERELSSNTARGSQSSPRQTSATITLAFSPQEAELITFAQEQGKLRLILRSPLDTAVQAVPIASWDTLLQYILSQQGVGGSQMYTTQPGEQMPEPRAEEKPVEIYRGGAQR